MCDISEPALEKAIAIAKKAAPHMVGKLETAKCDVSKESDVQAVVEKLDAWGGLDVIFNNAGIMHSDDAGMSHAAFCHRKPDCKLTTPFSRRDRHPRKNLGPHPKHQRQRRLVRQQTRRPVSPPPQEESRQYNQHRFRRRLSRLRYPATSLHSFQRRRPSHDPRTRHRARARRLSLQRSVSCSTEYAVVAGLAGG